MIKLVVFDLDGTILNTLDDLADSLNVVLKQKGYPIRTKEEVCAFVGNGVLKLIERAVPQNTKDEEVLDTFKMFKEYYRNHSAIKTQPYKQIKEVIAELRKRGYQTAVVSNKIDEAVKQLSQDYFPDLFDYSLGEKPSIPKKPAPDMVNIVLKELNLSKQEIIYVGDSDVDIETANNIGCKCISVTWGFRKREFLVKHQAHILIDEPQELLAILK